MNLSDVNTIIGQAEASRDSEKNIEDFPYREALGIKINDLKSAIREAFGPISFYNSKFGHYEVSTHIATLVDELQQSI